MDLQLTNFVKLEQLLEAVRRAEEDLKLAPIEPGTTTLFAGKTYEAYDQQPLGWRWRIKSGRVETERNEPVLFTYDSEIYRQERFSPLPADKKRVMADIKRAANEQDKAKRSRQISSHKLPDHVVDAASALNHALKLINDEDGCPGAPFPAGEHYLWADGKRALAYAIKCLNNPFHKAEPAIVAECSPMDLVDYACDAIYGRWRGTEATKAEEKILTDLDAAVHYAIHGRWPELEKRLLWPQKFGYTWNPTLVSEYIRGVKVQYDPKRGFYA